MAASSLPRFLALVLISFSFATFPAPTFASHSWGNYHWARTAPFNLKLGDNVGNSLSSSPWWGYLGATSSDWSGSNVLNTTIVAGGTDPKKCRPTSGRVEVCAARYGFNGWLGLAQIWASGSHITQGIAKLNDSYFNTAKYNTPGWRNLVMCQEVGHTFGLDHQDENFSNANRGTCMDYTNNPYGPPSNEYPDQHDYDQLATIYWHLDAITTVSQTSQKGKVPPPFADIDFGGPAPSGTGQWGRLIRSTNHGRTELYQLDFAGGRKVFTFVIWAEQDEEEQEQQ